MSMIQDMAVEHFAYGIEREWYDNPLIAYIRSQGDMTESAIDVWADVLLDTKDKWVSGQPYAVIVDLTHPNQGITPYSRSRTRDLIDSVPTDELTYVSLLLPRTFINQLFRVFLRSSIFQRPTLQIRIHHTLDEALLWLHRKIAQTSTS